MARRPDVQYIRLYTDGNAARELEPKQQPRKKARLPRPWRQKTVAIHIDPVAVGGILVAGVLMVSLIVGMCALFDVQAERAAMERYVTVLEQENELLQHTYENGYDLEEVERAALAMGMVPSSQVQTIPITVEVPEQEAPAGWWERTCVFFTELFG